MKISTNLSALCGESGRFPLAVFRKTIMIKYWIKIFHQNNSFLVKRIFVMLKNDCDANINYNGQKWAYQIKIILQQHGLEYIWNNRFDMEIPFYTIKQRIFDMYLQKSYSDINNSSRLQTYSLFSSPEPKGSGEVLVWYGPSSVIVVRRRRPHFQRSISLEPVSRA